MWQRSSSSPAKSPDWRALLGLGGHVAGWELVRAAQVAELARMTGVIALTQVMSALALLVLLWDTSPRWQLLGWFAAIVAVMIETTRLAARVRAGTAIDAPQPVIRRVSIRSIILGLLWSVPSTIFSSTAGLDEQLAICLVSTAVIASATVTVSAVPVTMLTFVALGASGLTLMMAKTGSLFLAALPVGYGLCLAIGGLISGRAFALRKWAEIALAEKHEVVSLLLRESEDHGADWLWQADSARRLRDVPPALADAAGSTPDALDGMPLFQLLAGERWEEPGQAPELRRLLERMNARERFIDFELPALIRGETRWWRLSGNPRVDGRGQFVGYHGVGSDITEARRSAEKIDRMARFDALTGLANRTAFNEALRKAMGRAFRDRGHCALMLVDLDRFKAVNDTLGHPVGDKLLRLVAQRLSGLVAKGDTCGRLGGDEFAVVIADAADKSLIGALGERIIAALSAPFEIDGQIVRVGASIGTATGPRDGRSAEMLTRNADLALYRAKEDGRGVHRLFETNMLLRAEKRRAIESALRDALDEGQLRLTYQPVVNARDDRIAGFEALLRWRHPELGDVPPDEFIPIAAEARLLGQIGEWVIRAACAEASRWPDDVRLLVNLAREQITDPQLPAIVLSALAQSGLPPSRLELEVGERSFREDSAAISAAVDRLRGLSVRISLDDFGACASALGHIRMGRFSTVKVDRSLIVAAASRDPDALGLIRAIVALTATLGMDTTAEGAETAAEQRVARDLGCTHLQGFLSGTPVPAEDARALIASAIRRRA
ncbi:diguanylate cyclase/phosphodiesterase with PAS/PAC sensor(s) [Sphingomonas laterariae]|uniref:Diguanylate cyclase/phosphodiesterase with PAS/PAC sensor(S) n=1 Tax=Edaphosphingomonas laterariae TaxID=861865 RepID=A0A239DZJ8_9SPHN|nr:EAL domain-containing protein [Sphingomonas laterariae]SNS37551.1 diguanylate cyclase/phosphodiesterase with PAS/PAC sensor(s) [Sphingomonas laterariae]